VEKELGRGQIGVGMVVGGVNFVGGGSCVVVHRRDWRNNFVDNPVVD